VAGESGAYSVDQLFAVSERDTLRFYGHGAYVAHAHTTAPFTPSQFAPAPHAFGAVMDGAAVVGAELKMEGPGQVAVTDTSGSFRLGTPALLPGEHTVTLRLPAGHDTTGWRVIVNGQSFGTGRFATLTFDSTDAVRLDFLRGASLDVPQGGAALPLLRVERVAPNPAGTRGPARVRYLLSEPARLRVEVFDALGRRALPPWDRMAPPGWGQVTLERPLARGSRLSPGIYLVRVAAEAAGGDRMVWSGRFVVLE
jgi:hypothetical protein